MLTPKYGAGHDYKHSFVSLNAKNPSKQTDSHKFVDLITKYMGTLEHCSTQRYVNGSATVVPEHYAAATQCLVKGSANVPGVQFLTHFWFWESEY